LSFIWNIDFPMLLATYPLRFLIRNWTSYSLFAFTANNAAYLVLQPIRFTRQGYHYPWPESLTLHFHPYSDKSERLFSVALAVIAYEMPPVSRSMVLCVARTFLIAFLSDYNATSQFAVKDL